jgi:hypothetical protein
MSRVSFTCLCFYAVSLAVAICLSMPQIAVAALITGLIHGGAILYQKFRLGRVLYHVLESLAHKLDFVPTQEPSEEAL